MSEARMRMTRRTFLGAMSAALTTAAGRSLRASDLGPGQHPLELDHERDGLLYLPRGYKPGGTGSAGRPLSWGRRDRAVHRLRISEC